jgi:SAM-dependent methyltransferase
VIIHLSAICSLLALLQVPRTVVEIDERIHHHRMNQNKKGAAHSDSETDDIHVPFEWLTNFSSLSNHLDPNALFPKSSIDSNHDHDDNEHEESKHQAGLKVLHVGCGSSKLGEMLQRRFPRYNYVLNVDNDVDILVGMKNRWVRRVQKWKYMHVDSEQSSNIDTSVHETIQDVIGGMLKLKYAFMDFQRDESESTTPSSTEYPDLDPFQADIDGKTNADDPIQIKPKFDLILDKSTLDCLLCSDDGATGLLCKIYEHLKHDGGVYFLISFHHVDFILPLLEDCPGVDWAVEHYIVPREVDSPAVVRRYEIMLDEGRGLLFDEGKNNATAGPSIDALTPISIPSSAWATGAFDPDEEYGKTVNVFVCRRGGGSCENAHADLADQTLNFDEVRKHIHMSNDNYFKKHNPMVTHVRKEELRQQFQRSLKECLKEKKESGSSSESESSTLPIRSCYEILFTDAEKEHLTFEFFMEDWVAYCNEPHANGHGDPMDKDSMTFETAVDFLETMQ